MNVRITAAWVLPIVEPPIRDGWIDVDTRSGTIVAVGGSHGATTAEGAPPHARLDLGDDAVILPALVNAHTHLELSHMAGAVPPASDFVTWVRTMLARRFGEPAAPDVVSDAIARAIASMEASGTAVVGDIGNTDAAVAPLLRSNLAGVHFREALGFRSADAEAIATGTLDAAERSATTFAREGGGSRLSASVAPHAPYSTSPALIRALSRGTSSTPVASIHLGESPQEREFLSTGAGPMRDLLVDRGTWDNGWTPPGTGPVEYLERVGALHERLLLVHGTQFTADDLARCAAAGATLVLCPRSNRWVGVGRPPVEEAMAAGVRLALGTDSLASVEDLNLFAELAALHAITPGIPARALLTMATRQGALALGAEHYGYLGPGATWRAVVRRVPRGVADVEQWLAADAADTADLRWLDTMVAALS